MQRLFGLAVIWVIAGCRPPPDYYQPQYPRPGSSRSEQEAALQARQAEDEIDAYAEQRGASDPRRRQPDPAQPRRAQDDPAQSQRGTSSRDPTQARSSSTDRAGGFDDCNSLLMMAAMLASGRGDRTDTENWVVDCIYSNNSSTFVHTEARRAHSARRDSSRSPRIRSR